MYKSLIISLFLCASLSHVAFSQVEEPLPFGELEIISEADAQNDIAQEPDAELNTPSESSVSADIIVEPEFEIKPEPIAKAVPHSGLFFDADSIGPNALNKNSAPREVDPKYEPGSRFVVVQKSAGKGTLQAQIVAGKRAISLGRHSSALELFEGLYKRAPNNRDVLLGLAISQQNNGFTESAISTYEELLDIDPNHIDATVNMLGLVKARYPAVAFRRLKELWEKNSQNSAVAAQLGLASASTGNLPDALRYLGIAASLEPNNASHYYNMAVLSDQAGVARDAIEFYQKALEVDVTYAGGRSIPREDVYDRLAYLRRL